jgi:hypothetical protein
LSPNEEVKATINIKYKKGGQGGFRGDKVNELLQAMI